MCCILFTHKPPHSGESGAGKTETTKLLVSHIIELCKAGKKTLEENITRLNPLLEAFGNAKTGTFFSLQVGVCLFVCLFVLLFVCLFVCFVCLFVCLFGCFRKHYASQPASRGLWKRKDRYLFLLAALLFCLFVCYFIFGVFIL